MSGQTNLETIKKTIQEWNSRIESKMDFYAQQQEKAKKEFIEYMRKVDEHITELKQGQEDNQNHNEKQDKILNIHTFIWALLVVFVFFLWFKGL